MKKIWIVILSVVLAGVTSFTQAQEDTTRTDFRPRSEDPAMQQEEQTEHELEEARDDMQEYLQRSSDKARLIENKVGPDGETIYMDEDGDFYYFNEKGKKKKIRESKLKDRPDNE